ncbi:D-glycero-beta-D-manno-heptose 1-phosphate adenylyltransferase [Candidatus Fermentibacteria bacterium]|nr:MAG: D-glycero-beta-D-manno-heptose 1-phosphate adenylyltransferase [Candidatus Fermentibacteria bacterium]
MQEGRILARTEAEELSRKLRAEGCTIVFTNGCFDILHPGHVHILRTARSFGGQLFVGVNTDASVTRLKGSGRPVVDLQARMALLAELRSVDFVVPFDEDTPLKLIEEIKPDVLVKGGDYEAGSVVGADAVISGGGRVEIVSLLKEFSTTGIIDALNSLE